MTRTTKVSSCDRLVAKLDAIYGRTDWCFGRHDGGQGFGWYLFAAWTHDSYSPDEGWAIEVNADSIRGVLIAGLWASR